MEVCVPPSVYMGLPSSVFLDTSPAFFCSIAWSVKRALVSWASRPDGVPCCPSPPRLVPTRRWYVQVLDSMIFFPGHASHKKGLQNQSGVGTLVSEQERRVVVLRINRLSNGRQPDILFFHWLTKVSFVHASRDMPRGVFKRSSGR